VTVRSWNSAAQHSHVTTRSSRTYTYTQVNACARSGCKAAGFKLHSTRAPGATESLNAGAHAGRDALWGNAGSDICATAGYDIKTKLMQVMSAALSAACKHSLLCVVMHNQGSKAAVHCAAGNVHSSVLLQRFVQTSSQAEAFK